MEEVFKAARELRTTPDLLPWVIFIVICVLLYKYRNKVAEYFDAMIDERKERKRSNIILGELIRNNTAALENNTAALESVKSDRGETRRMIEHHEKMVSQRFSNLNDEVKAIHDIVADNNKNITIIEDRVER